MKSFKQNVIIGLVIVSFFTTAGSKILDDKTEIGFDIVKSQGDNLMNIGSGNNTNDNGTNGSDNETEPGTNETVPDTNETVPGVVNETESGTNDTTPDTNQTEPGVNETIVNENLTEFENGTYVESIGYLIDDNDDGTFDSFYSNTTDSETNIEMQEDAEYYIDVDDDGQWDYIVNSATGDMAPYKTDDENKPIPGFQITLVICSLIFILFWKRRHNH